MKETRGSREHSISLAQHHSMLRKELDTMRLLESHMQEMELLDYYTSPGKRNDTNTPTALMLRDYSHEEPFCSQNNNGKEYSNHMNHPDVCTRHYEQMSLRKKLHMKQNLWISKNGQLSDSAFLYDGDAVKNKQPDEQKLSLTKCTAVHRRAAKQLWDEIGISDTHKETCIKQKSLCKSRNRQKEEKTTEAFPPISVGNPDKINMARGKNCANNTTEKAMKELSCTGNIICSRNKSANTVKELSVPANGYAALSSSAQELKKSSKTKKSLKRPFAVPDQESVSSSNRKTCKSADTHFPNVASDDKYKCSTSKSLKIKPRNKYSAKERREKSAHQNNSNSKEGGGSKTNKNAHLRVNGQRKERPVSTSSLPNPTRRASQGLLWSHSSADVPGGAKDTVRVKDNTDSNTKKTHKDFVRQPHAFDHMPRLERLAKQCRQQSIRRNSNKQRQRKYCNKQLKPSAFQHLPTVICKNEIKNDNEVKICDEKVAPLVVIDYADDNEKEENDDASISDISCAGSSPELKQEKQICNKGVFGLSELLHYSMDASTNSVSSLSSSSEGCGQSNTNYYHKLPMHKDYFRKRSKHNIKLPFLRDDDWEDYDAGGVTEFTDPSPSLIPSIGHPKNYGSSSYDVIHKINTPRACYFEDSYKQSIVPKAMYCQAHYEAFQNIKFSYDTPTCPSPKFHENTLQEFLKVKIAP